MTAAPRGWLHPAQAAGRRPPGKLGSPLFLLPAEPSRAQPNIAERSRTQPSLAEPRAGPQPPPERRRASERAAAAAEEAPPQGEEVPARRRPPAAEAARVAPRRERPAEAARPRGRAGGGDSAPARLQPPPPPPRARRLPSLSRRPASRCPGPSRGRAPGSTQAQDCRWTSPLPRSHCVDRTASVEGQLYWSSASAWALPSSQPRGLCWSEGAACHGGSHLPRGPHCHRLQWPRRLPAAAALGHSLLGLPFPLCGHRLSFGIQSQLQPWPLS